MKRVLWLDAANAKGFTGVALPDADKLIRERPAKTAALVDGNDVRATASLWLDAPPSPDGTPCAFVGHFASVSPDESADLLTALAQEAKSAGKRRVLAPIDGSTWRAYRCVVESNGRPPFFLEPQTPDGLEAHFVAAGFARAESYASLELEDLSPFAAAEDDYKDRLAAAGIAVRDFDMQCFETDLVKLHALSLSAFAENPYYAPLDFEPFAGMYRPAVFLFEAGLALIAERGNEAVGFIFAYRDGLDKSVTVLKTIAVAPAVRETGLASHLTRAVLRRAADLKCKSAIFALMHEKNKSFAWAIRHGRIFRRYALMAKDL